MCLFGMVAAGAAVYVLTHPEPMVIRAPSACSARRAVAAALGMPDATEPNESQAAKAEDAVSARVVTQPAPVMDTHDYLNSENTGFDNMSEDGRKQMAQAAVPAKDIRNAVTQGFLRTLGQPDVDNGHNSRQLGYRVLAPGLCAQATAPRPPPQMNGACVFNMSESYADALQERGLL